MASNLFGHTKLLCAPRLASARTASPESRDPPMVTMDAGMADRIEWGLPHLYTDSNTVVDLLEHQREPSAILGYVDPCAYAVGPLYALTIHASYRDVS